MSLFNELKRRNVFRVAAAYAVAGWLLTEMASVVLPAFGAPEWVLRVLIAILLLGFPIAVVFSWVYELTPEGIKPETEIDRSQSVSPETGKRLDLITIMLIIFGVGFLLFERLVWTGGSGLEAGSATQQDVEFKTESLAADHGDSVSIAVLPFVNMSSDPEQEYFSDGMTEELLNVLVKVPGILVAARTSAFSYKGQDQDVRQIGTELGVQNIVEGSVRKAGNDLRITAQLIRVSDGFHLWSESYDRKLENVFAIQEEIAVAIAAALEAPLGLDSAELLARQTTDFETYDLYLQARQLFINRDQGVGEAIRMMQDVVTRDPEFAPAWATLSLAIEVLPGYQQTIDGKPIDFAENLKIAERAARQAVTLDTRSAEGNHALANILRTTHRWAEAEDTYQRALEIDPNSIPLLEDWRQFLLEVGRVHDALQVARQGYELEPRSSLAVVAYADTLQFSRNNELFLDMARRSVELQPGFSWPLTLIADHFTEIGEFEKAFNELSACEYCKEWSWTALHLELIAALRDGTPNLSGDKVETIWSQSLWFQLGGVELVLNGIDRFAARSFTTIPMHHMNNAFMDEVRRDPRFKQVVERIHLVDYWRERGWPDYCWPLEDDDFECGAFTQ